MEKYFNIQLFAEENMTAAADLEPGISIDFVSNFSRNIAELQKVLGITDMQPMAAGTTIKLWEMRQVNTPDQVGEGEKINLTKVERKHLRDIELTLKKYLRDTSAEAIQKVGRNMAINQCDEKLVSGIQKEIKQNFYDSLLAGTGEAGGATMQAALANAWAKLNVFHEDEGATPIHFLSPIDVGKYLGTAQITTQTAFGMTYVEDFLGLGTVVISPRVTEGKVVSTAKENLHGAYIPANSGDVAQAFGLTADSTGLIGMKHSADDKHATIDTLIMSGVVFYPERLDGVFVGNITPAAGA